MPYCTWVPIAGILVMLNNARQARAVSTLAERIGKQATVSFQLPGERG